MWESGGQLSLSGIRLGLFRLMPVFSVSITDGTHLPTHFVSKEPVPSRATQAFFLSALIPSIASSRWHVAPMADDSGLNQGNWAGLKE
jgi:hypothetical protein